MTQFAGEVEASQASETLARQSSGMAISTDIDGPARRRGTTHRASGGEAVRAKTIRRAQRHSKIVRALRWMLPLGALAIAGFYALTLIDISNLGAKLVKSTIPKIIPANLTMQNPRYRGFNKDGGEYVLTAKTANRDPKSANRVLLNYVTGDLAQTNGTKTNLTADRGIYDTSSERITLRQNIRITSSSGGWAKMQVALIDPRTSQVTSDRRVSLGNATSQIDADTLKILQKSKELTLTGNVVAKINPAQNKPGADSKASDKAPEPETAPAIADAASSSAAFSRMFTNNKGPIEITSDRLEVDDIKKTAIFVGKVRAKQGEAVLTTPELRIAYDGAPSGGLTGTKVDAAAEANAGQAKIKSIVAAEPVTITQAPATRITSKTASFDAVAQRAVLHDGVVITRAPDTRITGQTAGFDDLKDVANIDGNVVVTQGADRRATGDHAEISNANETTLLTGDVVLTQGKNVLKGRRLIIDQKAGRAELTAPPMGASGPGRISAQFVQGDGKRPPAQAKKGGTDNSAGGGLMAMSSFKTDPGAPVNVISDQLEIFEARKQAVFRGNVEAQQGGFVVRTAELNAYYSGAAGIASVSKGQSDAGAAEKAQEPAAKLTHLKARGKVVVTSKNGQTATGDWADFDVAKNSVTVGGDVVLSQGRNVVRGNRLMIDMVTGESVIKSDNAAAPEVAAEKPGSGWQATRQPARPSAVFFPKSMKENAAKAKASNGQASGWNSTTSPVTRGGN